MPRCSTRSAPAWTHAVVVFRDQAFSDEEHLDFARRFDGVLHEKTGSRVVAASRLGNEALTDISNVADTTTGPPCIAHVRSTTEPTAAS